MGDTKIRINLVEGLVEAEGSEAFVAGIYADFKQRLQELQKAKHKETDPLKKDNVVVSPPAERTRKGKSSSAAEMPKIDKNLNLKAQDGKPSLRDFYAKYLPGSFLEKNLVFCYYLQQLLEISPINVDHVFTCYRDIKELKVPTALAQSLKDTARYKGWLDTSSLDDIKVPTAGTNFLEQDMNKAGAESEK